MITKLNHLLEHAEKKQYAVAGINVTNIEEANEVLEVAKERKESIVLQYSADFEKISPLDDFGPKLVEAAKNSPCDVALMFQHEKNLDIIKKALVMGFNCVMVDTSDYEKEEAIEFGKKVVDLAKTCDANIEVRLGDKNVTLESVYDYVKNVDIDCISCTMSDSEDVDISNIESIRKESNLPLVMHMTKLINKEQIKDAIKAGIRKVNFHFDNENVKEKTNEMMALVSSR